MKHDKTVEISDGIGNLILVELEEDGNRQSTILMIDGIRYHLERITGKQLLSKYRVDEDVDYLPQTDAKGYCYILAPFSR